MVSSGVASTDVITITAGDLQITAGDIDVDNGQLMVDTTQDLASNISRNFAGAGSAALLTVEDTNASSTKAALAIVNSGTAGIGVSITTAGIGNGIALDINHSGDYPFIDMDAPAARTGDVVTISMTNQEAERAFVIDGAWTGTGGEGLIDLYSSAQIAAMASLVRLDNDTAQAADGSSGYMLNIDDDSLVAATPVVYAVLIDSNANGALHVSNGVSLFADTVTFTTGIANNGDTTLGNAVTDGVTVTAAFQGASPIILDGATDNTVELTIAVTDPTTDKTLTLPDAPVNWVVPAIIGVGTTQTSQAGAGTSDVTGSSVALAASHPAAGQVYTWRVAGTKTGANVAMVVHLYALDGAVMSLTAADAAAVDWVAEFKMYITGGATQKIEGYLTPNGKVSTIDYAAGAKDLATAGGNVKVQIQSQDAGDTVTAEVVTVTYNE